MLIAFLCSGLCLCCSGLEKLLQRHERVEKLLAEIGALTVLDIGCGEGRLIEHLLKQVRPLHTLCSCFQSAPIPEFSIYSWHVKAKLKATGAAKLMG